jgi:hypothetical protein
MIQSYRKLLYDWNLVSHIDTFIGIVIFPNIDVMISNALTPTPQSISIAILVL